MDDNNHEEGNLEITGFMKHAESMDYKCPCIEWQQEQISQLNLKLKRKIVISTFGNLVLSPSHNPIKPRCMRGDATVPSEGQSYHHA